MSCPDKLDWEPSGPFSIGMAVRCSRCFGKCWNARTLKLHLHFVQQKHPTIQNTPAALLDLSGFTFPCRTEALTMPAKTCLLPAHATLHRFLWFPVGLQGLQDLGNSFSPAQETSLLLLSSRSDLYNANVCFGSIRALRSHLQNCSSS